MSDTGDMEGAISNRAKRQSRHRARHTVVFVDTSKEGIEFEIDCFCPTASAGSDGKRRFIVGTSSATHPAYVKDKRVFVDTDKRIDAFNRRYGSLGIL